MQVTGNYRGLFFRPRGSLKSKRSQLSKNGGNSVIKIKNLNPVYPACPA
jgi:hypothetical protein